MFTIHGTPSAETREKSQRGLNEHLHNDKYRNAVQKNIANLSGKYCTLKESRYRHTHNHIDNKLLKINFILLIYSTYTLSEFC